MRYLFFGLVFSLISTVTTAQSTFSSSAESDPAAKAVLEKMRNKYEAYQSMEVVFGLTIKLPEQPAEAQTIYLKKKGESYRVEMPGRTVISDGETLWMVMERNQEVQINDVPDAASDRGILSPEALFRMYETDEFAYFLVGQVTQNGRVVQQIEFKPLDEYADYSKLRLTAVKGSNELVSVEAFGKDGTRFTIQVQELKPNVTLADALFRFDAKAYPGYYVEDLRY